VRPWQRLAISDNWNHLSAYEIWNILVLNIKGKINKIVIMRYILFWNYISVNLHKSFVFRFRSIYLFHVSDSLIRIRVDISLSPTTRISSTLVFRRFYVTCTFLHYDVTSNLHQSWGKPCYLGETSCKCVHFSVFMNCWLHSIGDFLWL
jgi:hypothetical protein